MAYLLEVEYFNTFVVKGPADAFHIEESRIKGGYNETTVDLGVRAHTTNRDYDQEVRTNAITFSGIYNSKTGTNNTNQFPIGESITKAVDVHAGGIYKLFAEDTNLIIFQEEKVSRALIDKDAIYTAEGGRLSTSGANVIGEVISFGGNYGIGTNPESFAYFAGRKYFVDRPKGLILRLSRDGITEISSNGMRSYFRDNLGDATSIWGMWDMYNKQYVVSVNRPTNSFTTTFSEESKGWTSFHDYITDEGGGSLDGKFFTIKEGDIWQHYSNAIQNNYYGVQYESEVDIVLNDQPSASKNLYTLNYEGSDTWDISNIVSDTDTAYDIAAYDVANQDSIISGFKKKHNKYFANIINSTTSGPNEIIFGDDVAGIKGHFLNLEINTDSTTYRELFSVSTNYNLNSY
jgi:hypothetical protein